MCTKVKEVEEISSSFKIRRYTKTDECTPPPELRVSGLRYQAPELLLCSSKNMQYTEAVDLWSLGVILDDEARKQWPNRYDDETKLVIGVNGIDEESVQATWCHYTSAEVDEIVYNLYDDAQVKGEGEEPYICRVVELFMSNNGSLYFTTQWYYRAQDTVIKDSFAIDPKRIFFSEMKNTNPLDCLLRKININRLPLE